MVNVLYVTTSQRETHTPVPSREPTAHARPLPPDKRPGKGHFARAVGAFVPKVAAAVFERYGFHSAEIMTSWDTIVGADVARLTRPEAIKWPRGGKSRTDSADEARGGATLILASDPACALEISYRTQDIVDRINRYFGYRAIANLKILQVPGTGRAAVDTTASPNSSPHSSAPLRSPTATGDLTAALDALGQTIARAACVR
jgi:hypothetical protein